MTALLLDIPTDLTNRPTETAADPRAGLPVATERVAGAAFCVDLDPGLLSFTRRRIAEHFAVADDQVDVMITSGLLRLSHRLSRVLANRPATC